MSPKDLELAPLAMADDEAAPCRVLVVDDMATNRMLVRATLAGDAYQVSEAASGEQALELLAKEVVDVVLLDVNMPGIDGIETCRRIRADESLRLLPVIMLTTQDSTDDLLRGLDAGATDYVTKPFDRRILIARLRAAVQQHQAGIARAREQVLARQAEANLFTRATLDALPAHIAVLDSSGRIMLTNIQWRKFAQQNGLPAAACSEGASYLGTCQQVQAAGDESASAATRLIEDLLGGQRTEGSFEYPCHSPQQERWFTCRGSRFVVKDAAYAVIAHVDISARKQAELALQRANEDLESRVAARTQELERARQEAEQASQAKSAFLAAMSHEIRTPMNGVIGMVDVLAQTSLRSDQVGMVELIRGSALALLGIIDDILDFSKIEAGKLEIEHAPLDIATLVEDVCDLLDQLAHRKGVELTLFTDPALPKVVLGDATRLRQVLLNLTNNAIKFSADPGRPGCVRVRAVLEKVGAGETAVSLQVSDNGIGMDAATQARLFTSFSQADSSTTRRFGGTGLGLAISRQLVELMGGEIAVHSAPGQGATFSVRLPFALAPEQAATTPAPAADVDVAGLSCLVLGGAGSLADDLAAYLAHAGARVERAPDLAAARPLIAGLPPGPWVFVVDAPAGRPPLDELHAACRARAGLDAHFVTIAHETAAGTSDLVVIERGRRRKPRLRTDVVTLDAEAMHRLTFLQAVALAAGRIESDTRAELPAESRDKPAPPTREQAIEQGRLILVAEDNETNQEVILQQLKLLGLTADVAVDGRAALARWHSGDYALLLSDLHMPEMDGYQLTAAIRAAESALSGQRRLPIIALTANALKGEAQRCREVGMDDYLSKPVQLVNLKATLEKWLPPVALPMPEAALPAAARPEAAGASTPAALHLDVSVLEQLVGDDPAVIDKFLRSFRASALGIASEITIAIDAGQSAQAAALAHKLKSSARSFGALALGELCAAMEQAGKAGQRETLNDLRPRFAAELHAVFDQLDSLLA
ncbi:MAG: response regulator [Rhodocyclaceae bacterium]|nr:response regulator [Rhodocyclaceae bacterium]